MKCLLTVVILAVFSTSICLAGENVDLTAEKDSTSYSIGYQVGGDLDRQGIEVRPEILLQGIQDALEDQQPAMSPIEMHQTMVELQNKVEAEEEKDGPVNTEKSLN